MNNYGDLFNGNINKESLEDQKTKENIATLDEIFKGPSFEDTIDLDSYSNVDSSDNYGLSGIQKNVPSVDPLEKTAEISNVDLETLRNYSKMLHDVIDEPKEEVQSSSGANSNAKVLVKRTNQPTVYPATEDNSLSKDMGEILQAFISCSILSFVTAGMGVGWLLYIIMHI